VTEGAVKNAPVVVEAVYRESHTAPLLICPLKCCGSPSSAKPSGADDPLGLPSRQNPADWLSVLLAAGEAMRPRMFQNDGHYLAISTFQPSGTAI